jgi:hypothetical protein
MPFWAAVEHEYMKFNELSVGSTTSERDGTVFSVQLVI